MSYRIVRFYQSGYARRTVRTGLTLDQAQRHCSNPETSSSTCTKRSNQRRTERMGPWFDGYEEDL